VYTPAILMPMWGLLVGLGPSGRALGLDSLPAAKPVWQEMLPVDGRMREELVYLALPSIQVIHQNDLKR